MEEYNAIHPEFKPPPEIAHFQYDKAFDSKFILWMSERRSVSLEDMINDSI